MESTINIVQIVLSLLLISIILLQVKGQGVGLFGSAESSYRTRRGFEKTLFQFTIVLIVIFLITSILSVRLF
jgi:preprotein translocase subunit SecG